MEGGSSWLISRDQDRARMLEMDRLLQNVRLLTFGVLAVAFIACGPWIGWQTLPLLFFAGIFFALADGRAEKVKRPEYWIFGAWIGSQTMILISVLLSWAPDVPVLSWFAIPVITLGARFSIRGISLGIAITIAMMTAVGIVNLDAIVDEPPLFVMPLCLVIAIGILSTALMRSDVEHRLSLIHI